MDIFIIRDGEQTGPFDEGAVKALLSEGGVRPQDMAWRKGLTRWLPLREVIEPHVAGSGEPPRLPAADEVSGNGSSPIREPATAKQKAFLKYLGAEFDDGIGKDKAALVISDALENPKAQARIRKWHDEKLRLHPEIFQDEIDLRKANRASRYLELVQTEGAEVLKDVTKAHVQVLMESLDKRHPTWEAEPRAALWDYLFPSIGDHFPQLVQPAYKGRLKLGGTLQASAPASGALASGTRSLIPPPAPPGTLAAMWRGVFYGVIALGAIVGGIHFWQQWHGESPKTEGAPAAPAEPAKSEATSVPPEPAEQPPERPDAEVNAAPKTEETPAAPAAPEAPPPMAPEKPAPVEEKPAASAPPPAPAAPMEPAPAPPAPAAAVPPAAPAAPRTEVTLLQGIGVALPNGQVNLPAGTRLRFLALEGQNVRVAWNNNVFYVPAIATDVGKEPSAPTTAPAPASPPAAPAPTPTKKPSDDL
jgi:hypothetical protein